MQKTPHNANTCDIVLIKSARFFTSVIAVDIALTQRLRRYELHPFGFSYGWYQQLPDNLFKQYHALLLG